MGSPGNYPTEREMSTGYLMVTILFDTIGYALFAYRTDVRTKNMLFTEVTYQNVVFHYGVVWIAFTDLLVVNLPKNKRYWWNIFRSVQGIQIAWLTAALWIEEM